MSNVYWILASQSPRRQEIFRDLGLRFEARSPQIIEERRAQESIAEYLERNVAEKITAVQSTKVQAPYPDNAAILAADTVVVLGEQLLEKPRDAAHAAAMLESLSGRSHDVLTCFGIHYQNQLSTETVKTVVSFCKLSSEQIQTYVASGEPFDKSGSYGAQGRGRYFIHDVHGSYMNIVGLPISHVQSMWENLAR